MEVFLMGSIAVFAFLTLLSYILIVLKIPYLIIPIMILVVFYLFRNPPKIKLKPFNHLTILTILVFVIGILGQLAVISPSGTFNNQGDLQFWSSHGHDGAWHVSLMNEINRGYPFQNPVFADSALQNYHFFSDILPAVVAKYTNISSWHLYFRIFPLIYSLFLGISVYYLTKLLTKSHKASLWATIFTYFAGSFGYLIGKGESVFWATQIQSSSGNPPQIISNFLMLAGIYYILKFKENKKYFWHAFIILGTISSFKIYAGVVILLSLGLVSIYRIIKNKKYDLFLLATFSGLFALTLYLPNFSNSAGFLIFEPWWYIRTMIVEPSRLNLLDWELRRQTYIYEHNWKRVIWLEGMGFLIFFFGNLGMRFLGLWEFVKTKKIIQFSIVISLILPLLFLQKGVASNTAQFLQYFVLLFGILAGIAVSKIRSPIYYILPTKLAKLCLYTIFLLLMTPTQINLLRDFYSRPAFAKIPATEIEALRFIKQNTNESSVILTPPYNKDLNTGEITPPIWDWFDTSYVSALSERRTYFDDYEQVDIMGYDFKERESVKKIIFESEDVEEVQKALDSTNANILYFPKETPTKINPEEFGLVKIFENSSVEVWKTN